MKTIKIKTYKINELSEEAKQTAIQNCRDINVIQDDEWDFPVTEKWEGDLLALGYNNPKILYNGFGSQGDGACFTADVDIKEWIKKHNKIVKAKFMPLLKEELNGSITITHHSRYYYSTSTDVEEEGFYLDSPKVQALIDDLVTLIENEREELGNALYRELSKAYDSAVSDEAVLETIECNEFDFLEDGRQAYSL